MNAFTFGERKKGSKKATGKSGGMWHLQWESNP